MPPKAVMIERMIQLLQDGKHYLLLSDRPPQKLAAGLWVSWATPVLSPHS